MQKSQEVAYFLVPTDQHTTETIHPTMRALHDPPSGFEPRFFLQCLGFFPPGSDMSGEAKLLQEVPDLVIDTIVRATQFFEFLGAIAGRMQPIAADVAAALADVAVGTPVNGMVELAGPEPLPMDELVRRFLRAHQDTRQVVADVHARYLGTELNDQSLTPGDNPRLALTCLEDWLSRAKPA